MFYLCRRNKKQTIITMAKDKFITEKSEDFKLVDVHTGDLLDYNQTKKVPIEDFIMVYLASIPEMFALQGQQLKLLMAIWRLSSFNKAWCEEGNIFLNDQSTKEAIRRMGLCLSDSSIDVALHKIVDNGFLIKMGKGKYLLNPKYFFKGTLSDRSHIRLSVEVDPRTKESRCFFIVSSKNN